MAKKLMKGCEAIGEAAIKAGCRLFFGYPITPQNEIPEYMSARLPQVGGTFVQAESEVAASNMLYGAAGAGCRVMTSSSSPGISLMMEAISYMAGSELPVVIVNIMRGGPGTRRHPPEPVGLLPGHQGRRPRRLPLPGARARLGAGGGGPDAWTPSTSRTSYRNPVFVLGDGLIGQMMEPVEFKTEIHPEDLPPKPWATTGCKGRKPNIINSLYLAAEELEEHNWHLQRKYAEIAKNEKRFETYNTEGGCDVLVVAYGTVARIASTAIDEMKGGPVKVGLFRPITLWPYPTEALWETAENAGKVLTCELSCGQMVEDVRYAMLGRRPVAFYGRIGGVVMGPDEVIAQVNKLAGASV